MKNECAVLEALIGSLISPPILDLPRSEKKYTLDTDFCGKQTGFLLLQEKQNGYTRLVVYWSHTLTDEKCYLATTHYEYLAVFWAVTLLQPYSDRTHFTVRTEHGILRRLVT